jgi:hypothetical protein
MDRLGRGHYTKRQKSYGKALLRNPVASARRQLQQAFAAQDAGISRETVDVHKRSFAQSEKTAFRSPYHPNFRECDLPLPIRVMVSIAVVCGHR